MNLHDWIDELCDALDIETEVDEALVLDLAKVAADNVVRKAAPITTYLLGYAAGHSDAVMSAQYSQTAKDSHTRAPRCSRYGTSPLGDSPAIASVGPGRRKWIIISSTSRRASFTASQPRIDHEE